MPFFQSQLISAQPRHFTELKTRNSTVKLKVIAKGFRLETLSACKLVNACCTSPHSGHERTKSRKDRKVKPLKKSYSLYVVVNLNSVSAKVSWQCYKEGLN